MLEFYVLIDDFNKKDLVLYNIFNNCNVDEFVVKYKNKFKKDKDRDKLIEELNRVLMYSFWSKCEYEVYISDLFEHYEKKIDVYERIKPNINVIADMIINYWKI